MLETSTLGDDGAPRLVIVHGLFGSGRNWRAIARRFSSAFKVVCVTMRNHGGSFRDDDMSYHAMAGDLAEVIEAEGGAADIIGHSMGGKASMVLALTRPELVDRLVVADIAPVGYSHTQTHLIDAMEAVDPSLLVSRSAADRALAAGIGDAGVRAFLLSSLEISDEGSRWALNLEVLRRAMPEIVGFPEVSGHFGGPALFVRGSDSDYVTAEGRAKIREMFPKARHASLKNAGHWLHADQPRAFIETVGAFLRREA